MTGSPSLQKSVRTRERSALGLQNDTENAKCISRKRILLKGCAIASIFHTSPNSSEVM